MLLFVGDDWSEEHHDIEVQDESGRRLVRKRVAEGAAGFAECHALIGRCIPEDVDPDTVEVCVGIETDRGAWVQAMVAAGYVVFPVNPLQAARARGRLSVSGAKSDPADAHVLADLVRTDRHQLRPIAGDSEIAEAIKVVARAHKTLIWEQSRHELRLRSALLNYFPAALAAFGEELSAPEALELLAKAPTPDAAARLTRGQLSAALKRARRRNIDERVAAIQQALRVEQLDRSAVVSHAYAATVRAQIAILTTLTAEITVMGREVTAHFGRHPDAEIYRSQPGMGDVLGARVLAEFGDDPTRYTSAKNRKNYAGTSPLTRRSGKKKIVIARYVHNDRLLDALGRQAFSALRASPGARAYYDRQRARGVGHQAALRQLGNRLVGILHGCLKTGQLYNEDLAWNQTNDAAA
jgi:transposase